MAVFPPNDPRNDQYPYMRDYTAFLKKMERPLVGRKKEMGQLMAAMSRPELCNAILLAEAGSGKACDVDTPLPVADGRGYIRLGDVKPGDYVFNEKGEPVEVLKVFPQGFIHAYRVTFLDGSEIICNGEHLWNVRTARDAWKGWPYRTLTLDVIRKEGLLDGAASRHLVPRSGAVQRDEKADLPFDPYLMGLLLLSDCVAAPDFAIRAKADGRLRALTGVTMLGLFQIWEAGMAGTLSPRLDEIRGPSPADREFPGEYLSGSIAQRTEVLIGLLDVAGQVGVSTEQGEVLPRLWLNAPGKVLADGIRTLAASLGYRTRLRATEAGWTLDFMVTWEEAEGLLSNPEVKGLYHYDRNLTRQVDGLAITDIEDLTEDREMLCIYVAGQSHLFQIGHGHIVTHNTALVQGTMVKDTGRAYLEVDLPKMISNLKNENEMADKLKQLFREVEAFRKSENKEIVLFIDEFHQIVQLSPAAVEVLKPLLADSGTRGIRVIAATTYIEFQEYIASNLPLVERLQRINLNAPDEETVVSILRGMAERYGVKAQFPNDSMFHSIYEYTNRYIPSTAQPRKSILMLDSMIGWHRFTKKPMDMKMLADVIYDTEGVNISFRVNAGEIKRELDKVVLSQDFATSAIEGRLQICVADLNNKNRPMSSFLFTGSTGTGKANTCSTKIPVWTPDGSVSWKLAGDVVPGDYLFDRDGHPTKVLGVFPQGKREVYRVTLGDGRYLDVSDNHLWSVFPAKRARDEGYTIYETKTLLAKGLETRHHDRVGMKYFIPMNGAVEWPARDFKVDPYVIGALTGDGCLSQERQLIMSSDDPFVVEKVGRIIGAADVRKLSDTGYSWSFVRKDADNCHKYIQLREVLGDIPELYHVKSPQRRIPPQYMTGSIEQRWALVHGLFDTDGHIGQCDGGRYNISYSTHSEGLAYDVQELLYSLGIASSVTFHERDKDGWPFIEYDVHVCSKNGDKWRFFTLPRCLDIAKRAATVNKQREKTFDFVGIRSIERLGYEEEMVCFYVDNDDHLYQAGQFCVTHNTETTKQLCRILFRDDRALVRMDMTEYALPDSLERFRQELTTAVWTRPYCILLLDEIEKACAPVTRILLQVLDDGRLLDRHNREVTFKNSYIIITTNAGSEIYKTIAQYGVDDTGSGKLMEKYESLIRDSIKGTTGGGKFPPELLGRIDCLVPFQPLSEKTMAGICEMKLKKLAKEVYDKHHITVQFDKRIIRYIVQDKMTTDSDAGGARGVVSRIEREVTIEVARFINEHQEFRSGRTIYVCVVGNLAVDNKFQLETDGRIVVRDTPPDGDKGAVL